MKIINKILILSFAAILFSSCLKDLDTLPLNTTDFTSENAYANEENYLKALSYINGYYMLVGQDDPGKNDLGFSDSGQSEFLRQWINMNEMTCDGLKCVWETLILLNFSTIRGEQVPMMHLLRFIPVQ